MTLLDVAWVADNTDHPNDPNLPTPIAHRVTLTDGVLACTPWVTAAAGRRIPEAQARATARMCPTCWPTTGSGNARPDRSKEQP